MGVGLGQVKTDEFREIEENQDNWKHRSKHMICGTCMWYCPKAGQVTDVGRCRRRSPTMNGWPVMFASDWCGDHKLDETK